MPHSQAICRAAASTAIALFFGLSGCREEPSPQKAAALWELRFFAASPDSTATPELLAAGTLELPIVRTENEEWRGIWRPSGEVSEQLKLRFMEQSDDGFPFVAHFQDDVMFLQFNANDVVDANVEATLKTGGAEDWYGEWFWTSEAGPGRLGTVSIAKTKPSPR